MGTQDGPLSMLQLLGPPSVTARDEALSAVRLGNDFRLPASYRDFARNFGYGLLCDMFYIYIPKAGGDDLVQRSNTLSEVLLDGVAGEYKEFTEYEPDGSPELFKRLIPFGTTKNGAIIAWDRDEKTSPDEYMIYVVASKLLACRRAAPDLYDFISRCLDYRVRDLLGQGASPLPATFKPIG